MDASLKLSKTALILTAALSLASTTFGQSLSLNPPATTLDTAAQITPTQPTTFTVSGDSGTYSIDSYSWPKGPAGWFKVTPSSGQIFSVSITLPACDDPAQQVCIGTFVIRDNNNWALNYTVVVTNVATGVGLGGGTSGSFSVNSTNVVVQPGQSTAVTLTNSGSS